MPRTSFQLPFLLVVAMATVLNSGVTAFTPTTTAPKPAQCAHHATSGCGESTRPTTATRQYATADDRDHPEPIGRMGRRKVLAAAAAAAALASAPTRAHALKKRNEALCGTGFFEHIYEYKCTEIGDIEDEGNSRAMNSAENGLTDGLMGKLGLEGGGDPFSESTTTTGVSYENKKKSGAPSKQQPKEGGNGTPNSAR